MRLRLTISPEARADVRSLAAYLQSEGGPRVAASYLRALHVRPGRLREMPLIGVAVPVYGDLVCFVPCRCHVIYFETTAEVVLILRILHHAQVRDSIMGGVQEEAASFEAFA